MKGSAIMILKPNFLDLEDSIVKFLASSDVTVISRKVFRFTANAVRDFYKEHVDKSFFDQLLSYMISDACVMYKVRCDILKLRDMIGNTDPKLAEKNTLRYRFGKDITRNLIHCSDGEESARREVAFFENC